MAELPPGLIADLLRLAAFFVVTAGVAIGARAGLIWYGGQRGSGWIRSFAGSMPGTFIIVLVSLAACSLIYLAIWQ